MGAFNINRGISPSPSIELARSPDTAIEIISEAECIRAREWLQRKLWKTFPDPDKVSVVPVLESGARLADELNSGGEYSLNPIRMSNYGPDTKPLPNPSCLSLPDVRKFITKAGETRNVAIVETVIDSRRTVLSVITIINEIIDEYSNEIGIRFKHPKYFPIAYVSKERKHQPNLDNLLSAFNVHPDIWVGGLGCDLPGGSGRTLNHLVGMLPKHFSKPLPRQPYYKQNF